MALIGIDFETRSGADLPVCGAMNYFNDKDADILFLSYKIDNLPTEQWHPRFDLPEFIRRPDKHKFYAFNALFEYRAWNILGKKYNFGMLSLLQLIDVMAICGRFTYFQKLEKVGEVLNLNIKKDKSGHMLIKKICCPPFNYTAEEFEDFVDYGITDVDTMFELLHALPSTKLSEKEQKIWEMTQRINLKGIPIDIKAVEQILKVTEAYKEEKSKDLPEITGGSVTKATQTQRIVHWLKNNKVNIPNLQKETVETFLEKPDLPEKARKLLQLRQDLGRTSTAKYQKLKDQVYEGRIYDNLRYYGTSTGRWTGMGFQLQTLPRSKVTDAAPIIDQFFKEDFKEDSPISLAKSIVRGIICAQEGKLIYPADYSSIENRLASWVVRDEVTLQLFRKGLDQYKDMAAKLYGVAYEDVTDEMRQFCKTLVLGCQFGLGAKGFKANAEGYGITMSETEAENGVNHYREKYYMIKNYWYTCKGQAVNAVSNPRIGFKAGRCILTHIKDKNKTPWLKLQLPSGRALFYNTPEIQDGQYGPEVTAMGINSYTRKWEKMRIIPGRLFANIVQALARDVLAHGKLNLEAAGYKLIGSVHDEPIVEASEKDSENTLAHICELMCINPKWCFNMPLKAEGIAEKRYRKM